MPVPADSAWTASDAVLAAATGSIITLIGVAVQNIWESRRHKARLDHEATEREKQRDAELRRSIYVNAAAALANLSELISQFSTENAADVIERSRGNLRYLWQVHIVASEPVLRAMAQATSIYSRAALEIILDKLKIEYLDGQISDLEGQIGLEGQERSQEQGQLVLIRDQLAKQRGQLQMRLMQSTVSWGQKFSMAVVDLNIAVRNELGLPIDDAEYRTLVETEWQQQMNMVDNLEREVRERFSSAR